MGGSGEEPIFRFAVELNDIVFYFIFLIKISRRRYYFAPFFSSLWRQTLLVAKVFPPKIFVLVSK